MEIKNKLTATRWERGEVEGGRKGKGQSRNMYKRPMDKDNRCGVGGIECGRWGWVGLGRVMGEKWEQL